jgi:hypothetical protein
VTDADVAVMEARHDHRAALDRLEAEGD